MYRVLKTRALWQDVTLADPECEATIRIRYQLLDADEMSAALLKGLSHAPAEGDPGRIEALRAALSPEARAEADAFLAGRIVDWADLADEEGNPLECTRENVLAVLKIPYLRRAIDAGLWSASQGGPRKN